MKAFNVLLFFIFASLLLACARKISGEPKVTVFYSKQIKPMLEIKCTPCHMPLKGGRKVDLSNYTEVIRFHDDIMRRIQLDRKNKDYMPFKRDPLTPEEIALLKKWKEEGFKK